MVDSLSSVHRALKYLFTNPSKFLDSTVKHLGFMFSDKTYLKLRYRFQMGEWPDLENPTLFTEKIQWLKLHNHHPQYSIMVDKYTAKDYVASRIGNEYVIPTLGLWNSPKDIEWNKLPNQFVLKTTNGGGNGGVVICRDKSTLNIKEVVRKLSDNQKSNIYDNLREWPYRDVTPRILAESLLRSSDNESGELADYKFFCFNGEPRLCQVIRERNTMETIDFYDMEWNHMDIVGLNPMVKNGQVAVPKPKPLSQMIDICKILSKDIPFLRVDLYVVDSMIYFGEMTFFPASGIGTFKPKNWNKTLGDYIQVNL